MLFWLVWWTFLFTNLLILMILRKHPIYEPRVLFSFASLMWLIAGYGYYYGFENYLAFKPMFYSQPIEDLAIKTMLLFLLGYISLIFGASIKLSEHNYTKRYVSYHGLKFILFFFILIGISNFFLNVFLISGGNIFDYITSTAGRSYQVAEGQGVSAIGYLFGFIGINFMLYLTGKGEFSKKLIVFVFVLFLFFVLIKLSQGRIFQTLVFIGSSYVSYLIGQQHNNHRNIPYIKQLKVLLLLAFLGILFYFLRIISALNYSGKGIDNFSINEFFIQFVHYSIERGNLPNTPVVMTLLDKIPSGEFYLLGTTLFNWLLWLIPKSILPGDYLISLWIKQKWYLDVEGGGLPPTAVGEWYANFGYIGVIVGMFFIGYVLNNLYKRAIGSNSPFWAVLWANFSFGFVVIYPKTDLAQIPGFTMLIIFIFYISYVFIRNFRKIQ